MTNFRDSLNKFNKGREKGDGFEELIKWYLENSPIYKNILKDVWLWDDWPERWGRDKGIDLIAKTKDGNYWAIQAKDYDEKYSITKKDVDKFLSESGRKIIDYRLLIHSNNKLSHTAKEVIENQEKPIGIINGNILENENIDWPNFPIQEKKVYKKKQPRPHQRNAIIKVVEGFKKESKGKLIMACGTGKTLTSLWIKEKINSNLTIIFVPSIALLSQTLFPWIENSQKEFSFITVCSDKTVDKRDDYDSIAQKVSDLGLPTTTNPNEISKFMQSKGNKVIFSTYQSSDAIFSAQKKAKIHFDLMICDEAHKLSGGSSDNRSNVIDDRKIKAKKKLFMTATPKIVNKGLKKAAEEKDYILYSMDDEEKFGKEFFKLNFGEAINKKLLVDYEIIVFSVLDSEIEKLIKKNKTLVSSQNSFSSYELATQIGLSKANKKHNIKKVITFHNRVNNARKYAASLQQNKNLFFNKNTNIYSSHVDGKMPANTRMSKISELENSNYDFALISNARCLSEGIDVPSLDAIAFIDPRRSVIDIVQAIGRAIRTDPVSNKSKGFIFIPIIIDKEEEINQQLNSSSYSQIAKVFQALKAHDETLTEELKEIIIKKITYGKKAKLPKCSLEFPEKFNKEFINKVNAELITDLNESWYEYFETMVNYYKINGDSKIPIREEFNGIKLGRWASRQREFNNAGFLPADKKLLIEKTFPDWIWNRDLEEVLTHLNNWKKYYQKYEDIYVEPRKDKKTALWLRYQNTKEKDNKIVPEVRDMMLKLFPEYDFINYSDKLFIRKIQEYKSLVNKYGARNITEGVIEKEKLKYIKKDFQNVLRNNYKNNNLEKWKIDLISNEIPEFILDSNKAIKEHKKAIFEDYVNKYKSAYIKRDLIYKGEHLGNFAIRFKQEFASGKIKDEDLNYFNNFVKLGWEWSSVKKIKNPKTGDFVDISSKNYIRFKELLAYYKINKSSDVVRLKNQGLNDWTNRIKKLGFRNELEGNIKKLFEDSFHDWFWGNKNDHYWNENFRIVKEYKQTFGLPAPEGYKYKDLDINIWVRTQKNRKKDGKLDKDRIKKLIDYDKNFFTSGKYSGKKSNLSQQKLDENRIKDFNKFLKYLDEKKSWPTNNSKVGNYFPIRYVWNTRAQKRKGTIDEKFINKVNKELLKRDLGYVEKFWHNQKLN